jgi:hypothetical protein
VLSCPCRKAKKSGDIEVMQKVVFSISKVNRDDKLTGVGYLSEGNLLIPAISKQGKPYIRIFEAVTERCHQVINTVNEFKGYITVAFSNVPVYNAKDENYDVVDYIEVDYSVWFKYVD